MFLPKSSTFDALITSLICSLLWSLTYGHRPETASPAPRPSPSANDSSLSSATNSTSHPTPRFLSTHPLARVDAHGRIIESSTVFMQPARESDCIGVMKDGFGRVERKEVRGDWLWLESEDGEMAPGAGRGDEPAQEGEQAILFFVGGESYPDIYASRHLCEDACAQADSMFTAVLDHQVPTCTSARESDEGRSSQT